MSTTVTPRSQEPGGTGDHHHSAPGTGGGGSSIVSNLLNTYVYIKQRECEGVWGCVWGGSISLSIIRDFELFI